MKAPPFEYRAPRDLDEALEELSRHGDEAKILAGGQSLVPAMNLRLAAPRVIVDINRIGDLDGVEVGSQEIRVGALVRHARFDRERGRDGLWRLLSSISHHVGHLPIRLRGTFCGSLAHADPAAEWCTAALALDARVIASGARGSRTIDARDFFDSAFTTALAPDEILTEVRLPLLGDAAGVGFAEVSRTAGDFALVASLAVLRVEGGRIAEARIGLAGVEARPVRAGRAEDALVGQPPSPEVFGEAAAAAAEDVDPLDDPLCSADYRRRLVSVLTRRCLEQAAEEAA